jgi:hypothetical protein
MEDDMTLSRSVLFAAALVLASSSANAAVLKFSAVLLGSNEAPPTGSTASGTALFFLDTTTQELSVQESFTGLSAPASAAHIHCCAPAGQNIGVAIGFPAFPTGSSGAYSNTFDLSATATYSASFLAANGGTAAGAEAAFISGLEGGLAYTNIHNTNFPGGEIRGQIAAAPGPKAGAGLPGAIFAGLGLLSWRRRRLGSAG